MSERSDDINTAAAQPAEAENDGGRAKAHSLPDQIAADQYAKAASGLSKPSRGIRFNKVLKGFQTGNIAGDAT